MELESGNIGKVIVFINFVLVLLTFFFLFTVPRQTGFAQSYFLVFLGDILLILADWLIVKELFGDRDDKAEAKAEAFSTITVEENPQKHPLQLIISDVRYIIVISLIIGFLWWFFVYHTPIAESQGIRRFLFVPDLYSSLPAGSSPLPFLDLGTTLALSEAYVVAVTEEQTFSGLLFPTLWGILILIGMAIGIGNNTETFIVLAIITMIIAALGGAWFSAWVMHHFAYQKQLVAFNDAYNHFLFANLLTGITGTNLGNIETHLLHNFEIKWYKYHRTFQVVNNPLIPLGFNIE